MHISNAKINNFRLIKDTYLDFDRDKPKQLSLLIGRNNSGKTSLIVLFDKFLKSSNPTFSFNDFPISVREEILNFNEKTNVYSHSIKLFLEIRYDENDSFKNISDLILDLAPENNKVNVLFECVVNQKRLLKSLSKLKSRKKDYIKKFINNYLETNIYVFNELADIDDKDRTKLIKKDWKTIDNLINFQFINAKRDVASSDSANGAKKVLSTLTTRYFNRENKMSIDELDKINTSIVEMDDVLNATYGDYFKGFLKNAKEFLNIKDLKVISDLQSREILSNHSQIVYGDEEKQLPEHLNGLGYLNILYLLLRIEIKRTLFTEELKDINLLFIEEPEAHTHPQMQYVFIDKINALLKEVKNLQTVITTHSSHIVNRCQFEDLRCLQVDKTNNNVEIKNFHDELSIKYMDEDPEKDTIEKEQFQFLRQYLTLNSSELYFAEKIIFIEGTSEKLLLPYFIQQVDDFNKEEKDYIGLSSQNITILEVGANSRAFRHFIEFLGIKTLIITDIDTTEKVTKPSTKEKGKFNTSYNACPVDKATYTSNYSLRYFLQAPDKDDKKFPDWLKKLKEDNLQGANDILKMSYQIEDKGYQARSFEDAFIASNLDLIRSNVDQIDGLVNKSKLNKFTDFYQLTDEILKGKSEFASSILWLALTKNVSWNVPIYIKQGLEWIAKS